MNKHIPVLDLSKQYKSIKKEINKAIRDVIDKQSFIGGEYVEKLEKNISEYCQTKYSVAVSSGTDALYLSLWSLGIGKGDEVITTPYTFVSTAEVITLLGAKPVFVDINPGTFNINPDLIENKINRRTKAIIPVHLFGQPAEMDKIMKISNKHKIPVIEDACQAIGSKFKNKKVGNIGKIGCFSFYPSKNLGAYGDGGIITTNSKLIAERIRMLRNHGSIVKYQNKMIGICSRLDGIQANILSVKLKYLDIWNKLRKNAGTIYNQKLKDIEFIEIPKEINNVLHVYNQYTIRIKRGKRNQLKKFLFDNKISSMIYYPHPLHLLKAMRFMGHKKGDFEVSENASKEVLSLPLYPEITEKEIDYITKVIKSFKKYV